MHTNLLCALTTNQTSFESFIQRFLKIFSLIFQWKFEIPLQTIEIIQLLYNFHYRLSQKVPYNATQINNIRVWLALCKICSAKSNTFFLNGLINFLFSAFVSKCIKKLCYNIKNNNMTSIFMARPFGTVQQFCIIQFYRVINYIAISNVINS